MKSLKIFIILVLTVFGFAALNAEVFTWVDENGVRHYGDAPPDDTEEAKVAFPEYKSDESADKNRKQREQQEVNSLIQEIDADYAREQNEAAIRAQEAERNRKPTQQERIAAEKERLEERIAFLEQQSVEYFGSQRNKIVRLGYYRYRLQDLMNDPEKYFKEPASFGGNVKNPITD